MRNCRNPHDSTASGRTRPTDSSASGKRDRQSQSSSRKSLGPSKLGHAWNFPALRFFSHFSLCAYDFSVRRSDAGADPQKFFRGRNVRGNKEETREPPISGRPLLLSDPPRVATRSRKSHPGKGCCRARRDSFCNLKATRRRRRDRKHSSLLKYPAILRMLGRGRRAHPLRLLARKMLKRPCPRCCGGYLARGPRNRGSCILTASARGQEFPSFDCRRNGCTSTSPRLAIVTDPRSRDCAPRRHVPRDSDN